MAEASKGKAMSTRKAMKRGHRVAHKQTQQRAEKTPQHSWGSLRNFFSCKDHQPAEGGESKRRCKRIGCSGSLCSSRDTSRVMQRPETGPSEARKKWASKDPANESKGAVSTTTTTSSHSSANSLTASASSSSSSLGGSFRGMHLRRLSGCYECHMVVDPISGIARVPSLRVTVLPCPDCGEIFVKSETLELHQAVRHAVSELGPEDTSRNIVEIIFQSSWLKKQPPVCKIDRILKVRNTQKTVSRFEDYRDSIKSRANKLTKKHPRCVADGNELLRFHCTTLTCALGLNGSTNLCHSIPRCNVCSIIRDGFKIDGLEKIRTMATSGRAHDTAQVSSDERKRAMLVCRVIAGRVKKNQESAEECDSVAPGAGGVHSTLDELFVFNPKAILPCFVVVYGGF